MTTWMTGELLGFDFETTGVDRFNDVPVSYALVTVEGGEVTSTSAGLVNPGATSLRGRARSMGSQPSGRVQRGWT